MGKALYYIDVIEKDDSLAGHSEPSTVASVTVVSPSLTTIAPTSTTVSVSGGKSQLRKKNREKECHLLYDHWQQPGS